MTLDERINALNAKLKLRIQQSEAVAKSVVEQSNQRAINARNIEALLRIVENHGHL